MVRYDCRRMPKAPPSASMVRPDGGWQPGPGTRVFIRVRTAQDTVISVHWVLPLSGGS
jgi:hypothetical protein